MRSLELQGRENIHISLDLASNIVDKMKSIPYKRKPISQEDVAAGRVNSDASILSQKTTASTSADAGEAKRRAELDGTINELIALEESFHGLVSAVSRHILSSKSIPPGVSRYEIDSVFKGFLALSRHSDTILTNMKRARDGHFARMKGSSLSGPFAIASVFCKYVLDFGVFNKYVQSYCHSKQGLEILLGKKAFVKWLKVSKLNIVYN